MDNRPDMLLLVSVGNTRTRCAACLLKPRAGSGVVGLQPSRVVNNDSPEGVAQALTELLPAMADASESARGVLLIASVNRSFSDQVLSVLSRQLGSRCPRIITLRSPGSKAQGFEGGATLDVPIRTDLTGEITVGVDRVLCALAAHRKSGEACVVIDAGTAVTVDFVDAFGVFKGGVIAPGVSMMARALNQQTDALPSVQTTSERPAGPLGKTTAEAIALGCLGAVQGLARLQIDRTAEMSGAYPRIIATGGDAVLLFENDDLVEHIVPDLVLMGMHAAWESLFGDDAEESDDDADADADDDRSTRAERSRA
ncbi:MAG: type III pantothenate kinase [Phycisphaerales bacterium]|nr:type III pantothenate kinase [Phycisphaerales bacterium]